MRIGGSPRRAECEVDALRSKRVRKVVVRIAREETPKRRQLDFPGKRSLVALHDDSVVVASSNFRSDPFGTVFPIGLGEP